MTGKEVMAIVQAELQHALPFASAHGIDLHSSLVIPTKQAYESNMQSGSALQLWLVFEEEPGDQSGYKIVFDDETSSFGLAVRGTCGSDFLLGFYGTFLEALRAM